MDKIVINGGKPLKGKVKINGAKNAVLPIMSAALLVDGKTHIHRVPDLRDTRTMGRLLGMVGAEVKFDGSNLLIDAGPVDNPVAPYELVKTMRASFYVLGPLLSRFGTAKVSMPGGCAWGPRPVDFHLKGLEKLGARISLEGGYIIARAKRLQGNKIRFDFPSVGATGNILMAAVTAKGVTVIENAAREPEIVQLCKFLNLMGAKVTGIGSDEITIDGVENLSPKEETVIPDRIEAGTFLIAGAALGEVTILNAEPDHLKALIGKLEQTGAKITISGKNITVKKSETINPVDVMTAVYPGYPTDLQAQWIALMTIAKGSSIITDTVYHDRFSHVPELNRLGADIKVENNVAIVRGKPGLVGAPVMSTDIRASASLIIGGLIARGRTDISRVYHIDRGYEQIEAKFQNLGADIRRESE